MLEMITFKQAMPLEDLLKRVETVSANRPFSIGGESVSLAARAHATSASIDQPRQAETVSSAPAPAPAPVASGEEGAAAGFVEFVRGKKYVQAVAHLQQGDFVLDGDRLKIMVPKQSFHADWLRESSAQARLNEMASEFFGRPVRIEVEETLKKKSPDEEGIIQRREAERSALHNPIVQRVVETFQGKVVEVKPNI